MGGESTRPGAEPVPVDEELDRVLPVVAALAPHVRVSIDTRKEEVAAAALAAGASLVNDVSASLHEVAAAHRAGFVAMHMLGDPRTMQRRPRYDDVVAEVADFLVGRAERARAAGVEEVWIDPGIGFGKTTDHNLALLAHLDVLVATGFPVLVATSRKRFLGQLLAAADGAADPVPAATASRDRWPPRCGPSPPGAAMVRAHDVAATVAAAGPRALPVRCRLRESGAGKPPPTWALLARRRDGA